MAASIFLGAGAMALAIALGLNPLLALLLGEVVGAVFLAYAPRRRW